MNNQNGMIQPSLSLRQAADRLGMSKTWLWTIVQKGELRYTKLGNRIKIDAADLEAYRAARVVEVKA